MEVECSGRVSICPAEGAMVIILFKRESVGDTFFFCVYGQELAMAISHRFSTTGGVASLATFYSTQTRVHYSLGEDGES